MLYKVFGSPPLLLGNGKGDGGEEGGGEQGVCYTRCLHLHGVRGKWTRGARRQGDFIFL